jgi:hypothetical protein
MSEGCQDTGEAGIAPHRDPSVQPEFLSRSGRNGPIFVRHS